MRSADRSPTPSLRWTCNAKKKPTRPDRRPGRSGERVSIPNSISGSGTRKRSLRPKISTTSLTTLLDQSDRTLQSRRASRNHEPSFVVHGAFLQYCPCLAIQMTVNTHFFSQSQSFYFVGPRTTPHDFSSSHLPAFPRIAWRGTAFDRSFNMPQTKSVFGKPESKAPKIKT